MELMPHIKALLDDLIKMTKHIDIKRTDLADRYEDNTRTVLLAQQVTEILYGMPSFFTYNVYPKELLRTYGKWVKTEDTSNFGAVLPLTSSENIKTKMLSGSTMTISKDAPQDMSSIGDGWVKLIGNGRYYITKNYKVTSKSNSYNLSIPDSNGNYDPNNILQNFLFTGNIYTSKNLIVYIKDNEYNTYIPIEIKFISEYIEMPGDLSTLDESYVYNMTNISGSPEYTIFVENTKNKNEMIVWDSSVIEDSEELTKYLLRYKCEYYYSDAEYYGNSEYYFAVNEIINNDKFIKIDKMEYYKVSDDLYSPLYIESSTGNHIYDYETSSFIELTDEELEDYSGILYEKQSNDNVLTYYRYSNSYDGLVSQTTFESNGVQLLKYEELDDGNLKLYYNYGNENEYGECRIGIETIESNYNCMTYVIDDFTEIPCENEPLYYFYENPEGTYKRVYSEEDGSYYYLKISQDDTSVRYFMTTQVPVISHDTCIYNVLSSEAEYYSYERVLTDSQINYYYHDRNRIPEEYRDDLRDLMKTYIMNLYCPDYNNEDYAIPIYSGETNRYYRELNGQPPLNVSLTHPKIDRFIVNPYYEGSNTRPYLFELTDAEVDKLEELGYLKEYQDKNPGLTYLKHLGSHRIDVIKARQASPYDILHLDDSEMVLTKDMFLKNYPIAKNYIMKRYYQPNMFGLHEYYHAYIGFMICVMTLILTIVKSGDILIQNTFVDQETVDLVLKSYGFEHTFDSVPLIYRREIARNILKLIRNKGIDEIYETVYDLFNMSDIEVYKYYFRKTFLRDENGMLMYYLINSKGNKVNKDFNDITNPDYKDKEPYTLSKSEYDSYIFDDGETFKDKGYTLQSVYDLGISQVPISSNNVVKEIMNDSNSLNYDDITLSDKYWGVYESDEKVKEEIMKIPFNYMSSKYITLNNKFNLSELNFNTAYLLNYLFESTAFNNNVINLDIDEMNEAQSISNLLIMLFAIQSIKYNFDGNIPNDIVSAATIYKFNLDEMIADPDGKLRSIINYYLNYMTQDGASKALEVSNQIDSIRQENHLTNSIISAIHNDKTDKSVDELASTYLKNIDIDNEITSRNENSLYNNLLRYREDAKTITDFRCFDDLLKCISVCEETQKAYKFPNTIWEKMYTCEYDEKCELIQDSENTFYTDITHSWTILRDKTLKKNILTTIDSDPRAMIKLIDGTYIDLLTHRIVPEEVIDSDGSKSTVLHVQELDEGEWIDTDLVAEDANTYYEHFLSINSYGKKLIITNKNAIVYDFDEYDVVVSINNITRSELLSCENILDLESRIDIYQKENMLEKLDVKSYIYDLINSDLFEIPISRSISNTSIGTNNYAYIGHVVLDDFIESHGENLSGPVFYVEVQKNLETIENKYTVNIYRKCEYALTYAMYLREMAPELYNYLNLKSGESENEYRERLDKFSSTIIATIENSIDSKQVREQLNLSYVDFSNISKYIRLIINVFKSYSIDLSSMDIIYNIDDKSNNRIKIVDTFYSHDKYGIASNIHINSDISYYEKIFNREILKIKDEIYIEFYARQFYDVDPNDTELYYRVNNTANPTNDYKISAYWYGRSLDLTYNTRNEIDEIIIGKK